MLYEDFFGPWGLLIIIVIGVGIILIALLLFACFLTPGCIGYECFKKQSKEEKNVHLRANNQEKKNLKLNDISYRSWRLGSLYENDNNEFDKSYFLDGLKKLEYRWTKCIELKGDYVEK